jgi:glycosyltransferase involved in cell wall biosynthesis
MKILMIAPEPVFEPRGTPLSIVGRLKSLSDMNHRVDLLTYSMGKDVILPGVRIMRIPRIPGIRKIKIGPSIAKIPLDFVLLIQSAIRLMRERYDLIHTHEEAGFWGAMLARFFRIPHVYDMHSSLPQQLSNFRFSDSRILIGIFSSLEKWVLKYASCVITICPDLKFYVESLFPEKGSILIENVLDYADIFKEEDRSKEIRLSLHLDGKKVVLYTGTFESYQGLDLLIRSAAGVIRKIDSTVFLLVGGHPDQVSFYRDQVRKEGLENHFLFTGQVEPQDVNSYIRCPDRGYPSFDSYAGSGRPCRSAYRTRSGKLYQWYFVGAHPPSFCRRIKPESRPTGKRKVQLFNILQKARSGSSNGCQTEDMTCAASVEYFFSKAQKSLTFTF